IQVYSDYNQQDVLGESNLTTKIIEEYAGKYENVIDELKKRREDTDSSNEGTDIDIFYELSSVHTDEINYNYILSLIQAFIPDDSVETKELSNKDIQAVSEYINELGKTNPGLADLINSLWLQVQLDPELYRGQSISNLLDALIEETIQNQVQSIAEQWFVGYDELLFLVKNYRRGSS
ncbi:hypothetical protein P5D95_26865, partial [Vibrio parahaemolyticus]|nr:hypothetical protein [Vibrio parahaemolyticus]